MAFGMNMYGQHVLTMPSTTMQKRFSETGLMTSTSVQTLKVVLHLLYAV
jgi:hypothetical protein